MWHARFIFAYSSVNVFVSYDSVWMLKGHDFGWIYEERSCTIVSIQIGLSYSELVDELCEAINVKKCLFDMILEDVYPSNDQPLPPFNIKIY